MRATVDVTSVVCSACGYPGLDSVTASYAAPADALAAFDEVSERCDGRLKHVTDTDLAIQHERFGTVADLMAMNAHHLEEHAAQIRNAAAST